MSKRTIVCAYVDPSGDIKEEYLFIKREFEKLIGAITFKKQIRPEDLDDISADVYVLDFAGIGIAGASGCTDSVMRQMIRLVEDKPGLLIIFWSSMSGEWYKDLMKEEASHLEDAKNVIFANESYKKRDWCQQVKGWLGVLS